MTTVDALNLLHETLEEGDTHATSELLEALHPSEIARILESLPAKQREQVWELESVEEGEVLPYVSEGVRVELMQDMDPHEVAAATEEMDIDDAADLLQDLPDETVEQVLQAMAVPQRQRLTQVLFYPEDTAGGIMNIDTLTVRPEISLDVIFRYLRRFPKLPSRTDMLIVVDRDNKYLGGLLLTHLLTSDPKATVNAVMSNDITPIPARTPTLKVARLFEERDFISTPVVDEEGYLVGRITVDDVIDVIRTEAEHNLMGRAGLDEEDDMFASTLTTTYHRAFWLGINLTTAFLAAWVIGLFEETLDKVVALAVLMPIVASMGGIAGSQTLTVVIRGIALGKVTDTNIPWLLRKEVSVGLLNGFLWSTVVACVAMIWFSSFKLGLIIGVALIINLFFAALSGMLIPVILNRLSIDPALAGGVILTTVTDVIGFAAFLGLATFLLVS